MSRRIFAISAALLVSSVLRASNTNTSNSMPPDFVEKMMQLYEAAKYPESAQVPATVSQEDPGVVFVDIKGPIKDLPWKVRWEELDGVAECDADDRSRAPCSDNGLPRAFLKIVRDGQPFVGVKVELALLGKKDTLIGNTDPEGKIGVQNLEPEGSYILFVEDKRVGTIELGPATVFVVVTLFLEQ